MGQPYNLVSGKEGILQVHMPEEYPTIAEGPIGIARVLIDPGTGFCLIINEVYCKKVEKPMPKLSAANCFRTSKSNLSVGSESRILAGGAHHTAFSYDLTTEQMVDWADVMEIETVGTDGDTTVRGLKNGMRWNAFSYR